MSPARFPERRAWLVASGWVVALGVLLAMFPPFHVRPLIGSGAAAGKAAPLDVPSFAARFWNERLAAPGVTAVDAGTLAAALTQDPGAAEQKYGRRIGIGGRAVFLVSGRGRISSIDRLGVWISAGDSSASRMVLLTGPIFGNALRDASGLLDPSRYSSFDFNALSTELDRLAEVNAQPPLRSSRVGEMISFVAAGEIHETDEGASVLRLAPIRVQVSE